MGTPSYNWVSVDLAALRHNYEALQKWVGPAVRVMAVVKANAYGHGLVEAAKAFAAAGAVVFGVAELEEAVALREAGLHGEIVVLFGAPSAAADEVAQYDLSPVVFGVEPLAVLSQAAVKAQKKIRVHLKVDVGMGRLGVLPAEAPQVAAAICALPGLSLAGLLSHFPQADLAQGATQDQYQEFEKVRRAIAALAPEAALAHIANSAGVLRFPEAHATMVRPGISLYGYYPSAVSRQPEVGLRPAMGFHTQAVQVKEVPAGYGVSYGHRFVTSRPSRLAVLPVGYDDGYLRSLTGKAQVLIRGQRAPVVGTICMNACMADVTGISGVDVGEPVVLMGGSGEAAIDADEIAGWMGTISYEVLCLFGSRNRHVYGEAGA
ncbi:MAG: alanine racemase [Thermodesulfobacteriota bacterium]